MTWSFNTLDNEMGEELTISAGSQTPDNFITDTASSSADKTALIPSIQKEDSMDIAATSEDHTALALLTQKEGSMDTASTSEDHTALAPSTPREESKDIVSTSGDHTALVPFNLEKPSMDIADIPAVDKSETSITTNVATGNDCLPIDDPAHGKISRSFPVDHTDAVDLVGVLAFAPSEIRHMIYKLAMTADDGQFLLNDQTTPFRPNVATSLLRVK
jgi:hypothetical protein